MANQDSATVQEIVKFISRPSATLVFSAKRMVTKFLIPIVLAATAAIHDNEQSIR